MLYRPHVEVLYIDVLVRSRLSLAPQEQTLLGRGFFDWDVLDKGSKWGKILEVKFIKG